MECPKCQADITDESRFCSKCGTPIHPSEESFISQTRTILKPMEGLLPGTTLAGKYKTIEVLGRGGMGIVYKAEDTLLKRHVALKFLPPELIQDKEVKERFVLEAQTAAALTHPNICTIHEINEQDGESFIAMEYVKGQNLREKLIKAPLEVEEILDITIQVARGLDEAHSKNIIHRDIKSANIMITEKGQAKIMDFGLAKVKGGTLLTREGTTLGTVAYMSPEQARGEEVDQRTDIWSLGVVLYEMLTGELPFKGDREASILYSIVHEEPRQLKDIKSDLPSELEQIVNKALKKKVEFRYASATEMLNDLKKFQDVRHAEELGAFNLKAFLHRIRRPQIAIPVICAALIISLVTVWFFNRQAKIRWAREEILPTVERMIEANDVWRNLVHPYRLAERAEAIIPHDPRLAELFSKCSLNIDIKTEPPGASIYMKEYSEPEAEWLYLGVSPIEQLRVPVGIFRWKFEKQGYETVLAAASTWDFLQPGAVSPYDIVRTLDKEGSLPSGMVRVQGTKAAVGTINDFFIDRYEVTNRQYKEFVNAEGYRNRDFWKHPFAMDGKELTWEEAMKEFVDLTGQPGPSTWQAGDYQDGQDDYPVSGVSWYEAAAYAEFARKSLPTDAHWNVARGLFTPMIQWPQVGGSATLAPFSNFQGKGPVPVGSLPGITPYGAYDMAGNVREWCWNETPLGRIIRGGAWDDNSYAFGNRRQMPSMDRSPQNGIRLVFIPNPEAVPDAAYASRRIIDSRNFYEENPVSDPVFQAYKERFSYDRTDLNARVESKKENPRGWIYEKISFDAAYGSERVLIHLFLPQNTPPPYQTVIYFPGSIPTWERSSENIESFYSFPMFLSYIVKNGRAVLFPVYKGTFERGNPELRAIYWGNNTHQYSEFLTQVVKDFKRCIDYLETREDIDSEKIAYYGMSWGGALGAIIPAVEDRLKVSILFPGGLVDRARPEVHPFNYVTRVKIPTLMLNGRYDSIFPLETSIKPMFDLLGTPDGHKELKLYETDHLPPRNEYIREVLAWLDKYLGPVE
jgi:formylglycine-generating enzyme required for sulfatase activity/tRNA A-37 threonylcarbamoyl transferase component Bud32/predicted esterase